MRIMSFICVFLACGLIACFFYINIIKKENLQLKAENNGFRIEIKRREEVEKNVQGRKEVVEKLIYKDKEVFDWTANISNSAVINELRLQCKSCSASAD